MPTWHTSTARRYPLPGANRGRLLGRRSPSRTSPPSPRETFFFQSPGRHAIRILCVKIWPEKNLEAARLRLARGCPYLLDDAAPDGLRCCCVCCSCRCTHFPVFGILSRQFALFNGSESNSRVIHDALATEDVAVQITDFSTSTTTLN